jgi:hypothetical protein
MTVATLRRYLQPSPTLRWHPWAPLVTLLLAFAFVFALGIAAGMKYEQRRVRNSQYSPVIFEMLTQLEAHQRPTAIVIRRAQRIDNAVAQLVHEDEHKGVADRVADGIQPYFWPDRVRRVDPDAVLHDSIRRAAEWRLANLSAGAPAWEQTAAYCNEWKYPYNVIDAYERYAKAYSTLLGREITAKQLAPAVPGGVCK